MWWSVFLIPLVSGLNVDNVYVSELFQFKVDPYLFNLTFNSLTEQFCYRASKKGYPDLPQWLSYMYSKEHHSGFLFGTPPDQLADQIVPIEIIALDQMTFETRRLTLNLFITPKVQTRKVVQMKIDNLNWIQMMDPGRVETLKNVFRLDLWPESINDLQVLYLNSAIKLGARRPLNPREKEGVVVHLASSAPFSNRLLELQEEVKPLYVLRPLRSSCAFKRTSVQTKFENSGFKLDWCSFRIVDEDEKVTSEKQYTAQDLEQQKRWEPLRKQDAPIRNYSDELAFSICIPVVILTLLVAMLTIILCFHHEDMIDEESEKFFEGIFDLCIDFFRSEEKPLPQVQMVQYSPLNNQPVTTLRSLRDITPNHFVDGISLRSHSPGGSVIESSPVPTMRPQPPPYPRSLQTRQQENMQRFVIKKAEVVSATTVKFTGYLKKKRERFGGWKKMWFVLQNQLLLGYGSREEYEERLAPFKDVISLVPGTHIIPMQENKFTIETTSKMLYMFRCDDPKTCSDWITILVESLKVCTDKPTHSNNSHIPKPIFNDNSHLHLAKVRTLEESGAKLAIGKNAAKLLKSVTEEEELWMEKPLVQNFRLHDESGRSRRECQSVTVTQINRMFKHVDQSIILKRNQPFGKLSDKRSEVKGSSATSIFHNMKKFIVRKTNSTDLNQNQAPIKAIEEQIQNISIAEEDGDETEFIEDENDNRELGWRNRDSYKNMDEFSEPLTLGILGPLPQKGEPVYAVVDKKSKKIHERSTPPSPPPLKPSNDYEEIGIFMPAESTETIYEPVDLPKSGKNFWKSFNMDTFVDITKRIRERTSPEGVATMKEIRKRFGASRRSLKEKVMKMYSRNDDEIKVEPKRRKKFFGAFGGRVQKTSRTSSMCFEEFVPAKKFTFAADSIPEEIVKEQTVVQNIVAQEIEAAPGST